MAERGVCCELLSRLSLLTGKNTRNFFNLKLKIDDESADRLCFLPHCGDQAQIRTGKHQVNNRDEQGFRRQDQGIGEKSVSGA